MNWYERKKIKTYYIMVSKPLSEYYTLFRIESSYINIVKKIISYLSYYQKQADGLGLPDRIEHNGLLLALFEDDEFVYIGTIIPIHYSFPNIKVIQVETRRYTIKSNYKTINRYYSAINKNISEPPFPLLNSIEKRLKLYLKED